MGTGPNLSLREPINATCMDYYSYEKGTEVETFFCSDSSGSAAVNIDIFCYGMTENVFSVCTVLIVHVLCTVFTVEMYIL